MSDTKDEKFSKLHDALLQNLLECIQNGTATAADKAVARNLLRDAGIQASPVANRDDMLKLADALPFKPGEEEVA